jgi:hypothetical protein
MAGEAVDVDVKSERLGYVSRLVAVFVRAW